MKTFDRASQTADFFAEAQTSGEVWLHRATDGALVALQKQGRDPVMCFWSLPDRIPRLGHLAVELIDATAVGVPFAEWTDGVLEAMEVNGCLVALNPTDDVVAESAARVRRMLEVWLAARVEAVGVRDGLAGTAQLVVGYGRAPWRSRMARSRSLGRAWSGEARGEESGGLIRTAVAHAVDIDSPSHALCGTRIGSIEAGSSWPTAEGRPCDVCRAMAAGA